MSEQSFLRKPNARQWCPGFREHLVNSLSSDTCSFLADLEPSAESIHANCTQAACTATLNWREYVPQHCRPDCTCELVGPDPAQVQRLILDKKIPLLRLRLSSSSPPQEESIQIDVVPADFTTQYVAISHVWTGGLGNPRENKVHRCQLAAMARLGGQIRPAIEEGMLPSFPNLFRRLHRRLTRGDAVDLFWVDTLCIPVREFEQPDGQETAQTRQLRGQAIDRMTQVYAGAHSVCVLDPELRRLPDELLREDPARLFGIVRRCDWMRRCWTYQEAAMARRIFVVLRDGPVYLNRERYKLLKDPISHHWWEAEQRLRLLDLTKWLSDLPAPRPSYEYECRDLITGRDPRAFAEVWNALVSRSTSHSGDRFLIFALMMNLVPGDLLQLDNDARLKVIFNSLEFFPVDFLFNNAVVDRRYWLPDPRIEGWISRSTCGRLRRVSFEADELYLDANYSRVGTDVDSLSLWVFPRQLLANRFLSFSVGKDAGHVLELRFRQARHETLLRAETVALLVKNGDMVHDEAVGVLFDAVRRSDTGSGDEESEWQLNRVCTVRCVRRAQSMDWRATPLGDNLLLNKNNKFYVSCSFTGAGSLRKHRDLSRLEKPGVKFAVPQFMTLGAYVCMFYMVYTALVAAIALSPNAASFGWGFVFFLLQFWGYQVVFQMFLVWLPSARHGDKITYMAWLDDLTPDWPPALPRRLRGFLHVNYGPRQTCFRLAVGTMLTVLGIVYHSNRNVRWLVAWGLMIVLEVALRWVLELLYNYYWTVRHPESHVLVKEFWRDSRMTKWCKRAFGWPRELTQEQIEEIMARDPQLAEWVF